MSKHSHISNSEDGSNVLVDRISALHDTILSEILSLLPTKDAVSTSCLAKRWKLLWTTVTNLDLDFYYDPEGKRLNPLLMDPNDLVTSIRSKKRFTHFLFTVINLHKQPFIHKFRFRFECPHLLLDGIYPNVCVLFALVRKTQEIDLSFITAYGRNWHELPTKLFDSTTLVVLKLKGYFTISISENSPGIPNLKTLHLIGVRFEHLETVNKLFANSQNLEDVAMDQISIHSFDEENTGFLTISCPHLKRLDFHIDSSGTIDLELNLPALESLLLVYPCSPRIVLKNLSSLVEATLDLGIAYFQEDNLIDDYSSDVNKILEGVYNVKFLSLSDQTIQALACADFENPKFPNLKRLKVGPTDEDVEWLKTIISKLIQYSKNPEIIYIDIYDYSEWAFP